MTRYDTYRSAWGFGAFRKRWSGRCARLRTHDSEAVSPDVKKKSPQSLGLRRPEALPASLMGTTNLESPIASWGRAAGSQN